MLIVFSAQIVSANENAPVISQEEFLSNGPLDVTADTEVDVIDQELASTTGLGIDLGENTTVAESELDSELGTGDAPPGSEIETGLQADVEGIGAGEDLASDPADGLSSVPGL